MVVDRREVVFVAKEEIANVGQRKRILGFVVDFGFDQFKSLLVFAHFDKGVSLSFKEEFIFGVKSKCFVAVGDHLVIFLGEYVGIGAVAVAHRAIGLDGDVFGKRNDGILGFV